MHEPSILIVAPRGMTNLATPIETSPLETAQSILTGMVAAELDVAKLTIIAGTV